MCAADSLRVSLQVAVETPALPEGAEWKSWVALALAAGDRIDAGASYGAVRAPGPGDNPLRQSQGTRLPVHRRFSIKDKPLLAEAGSRPTA